MIVVAMAAATLIAVGLSRSPTGLPERTASSLISAIGASFFLSTLPRALRPSIYAYPDVAVLGERYRSRS
jgi:hypothetical protein